MSRLFLSNDWVALARAAHFKCEQLAAHCFVSERQLERFFSIKFQQTPKQWMQALRMRLAREFLERGYTTKAVAQELHYAGPCQFCREFKRFYHKQPHHFAPQPECRVPSMMSDLAQS
jgi:transcriptional regulator GlxA family with amidase domain